MKVSKWIGIAGALTCLQSVAALADSVSLPLHTVKQPAADLMNAKGQPIDVGAAASAANSGQDLSLLNPAPSKLWQNKKYAVADSDKTLPYPPASSTIQFISHEARNRFTYMARVQDPKNPSRYYRFTLSRFTNTMLMRAALMRKLGYYVPAPRYYQEITIRFASKQEMDDFVKYAEDATTSDFTSRKWIIRQDDKNFTLTFSDAVLEPAQADYFDAHWGFLPNPQTSAKAAALVEQYSRYRAFRALIIPLVLVDVPESVNRFSPKAGSIYADNVVLNHDSAATFSATSIEDARWAVRRIAELTENDLREIVAAGAFPKEIDALVYAKLVYRASNLLELTSIAPKVAIPMPDLNFTSPSGLVTNGKVTKEFVEGYPQRFSHGDRESPFTSRDFGRYLWIDAVSTGIKEFLSKVNDKLQAISVEDIAQARKDEIQQKIMDHVKSHPFEPLYQNVESWGGPIGNMQLDASRHVTTGTYYDSQAPIQLVDNLSIGATMGYFRALDGLSGYMPMAGGNISYTRDFTHVRPIESIKEGMKESWGHIFIMAFMKNLGSLLDQERVVNKDNKDNPEQASIDVFLSKLKDGEVFTITDSLALSAYLQNSSPIDVLFGLQPLSFLNSINFGADASRVLLQQVQITRTGNGIQVYIRSLKNTITGAQLDVNYYLNLLRARASMTLSDIHTDAYIIDYNSDLAQMMDEKDAVTDKLKKTRDDLRLALRALFKEGDTEILKSKFADKHFELQHNLKTTATDTRALVQRFSSYRESHELKLRYPANPDHPELKPEDEEVNLFAYRRGDLIGRDIIGFLMSAIEGIIKKPNFFSRAQNPNPADVPFGEAHWRIVTTEADLTTTGGDPYPTTGILQRVWGGWKLSHDKFVSLLGDLTKKFNEENSDTYRLIEPETFANVKSVEFYRITSNISIFEKGLNRIRDLLLQPGAPANDRPQDILGRIFSSFSSIGSKRLPGDAELFNQLMTMIGNGDRARGLQRYTEACKVDAAQGRPAAMENPMLNYTGAWSNGRYYDCLAPWVNQLLALRREFNPDDKRAQTKWATDALAQLEENLPLPALLQYIGKENYIYFVRVNGFRTGDEDGDLEFFSNTSGDPADSFDTASGVFAVYANKTGISPVEIVRTNGSFR